MAETEIGTNAPVKRAELYPLSKKEFETLYDKAWDYGWVYGKFFQELYDEYLVNWVYFVDYLDFLKGVYQEERMYKRIQDNFVIVSAKNQNPIIIEAKDFYLKLFPMKPTVENFKKEVEEQVLITDVEILIGEAPPYWKGNAENKDKSYFYNPSQIHNSPWLNGPANWKSYTTVSSTKIKEKVKTKIEKLKLLADNKVVLIDFLPFPIIQNTKVRQNITGGFSYLLSNYFIDKYKEITSYINNSHVEKINFRHGFVATTYTSLQFIFDNSITIEAKNFRKKLLASPIEKNVQVGVLNFGIDNEMIITFKPKIKKLENGESNTTSEITPLFKFIYELHTTLKFKMPSGIAETIKELNELGDSMKCPIFMVEGGSVNMSVSFFNSIDRILGEKEIEKINSDLIESNNEIDE